MFNYKYCLIISQYYHSRHSFIVKYPNNYINTCEKFLEDIEDYKRENRKQPYNYGDFKYMRNPDNIYIRYNVNDEGDIYIINSCSIADLLYWVKQYSLDSYKESRRYIRKNVLQAINKHHDFDKIKIIVDRHFKIL